MCGSCVSETNEVVALEPGESSAALSSHNCIPAKDSLRSRTDVEKKKKKGQTDSQEKKNDMHRSDKEHINITTKCL